MTGTIFCYSVENKTRLIFRTRFIVDGLSLKMKCFAIHKLPGLKVFLGGKNSHQFLLSVFPLIDHKTMERLQFIFDDNKTLKNSKHWLKKESKKERKEKKKTNKQDDSEHIVNNKVFDCSSATRYLAEIRSKHFCLASEAQKSSGVKHRMVDYHLQLFIKADSSFGYN